MLSRQPILYISFFILAFASAVSAQPDVLWEQSYGGYYYDYAASVLQTDDGGYVLAGSYSHDEYNVDMWLVKTDEIGDTLWTRTFGGLNYDACHGMEQTADGGYILVGQTFTFGGGCDDVWLIKTDSDGDSTWSAVYGGGLWDRGLSVQQTIDGGYIIVGETKSFGSGDWDLYLIKTNSHGDTTWTRTHGGSGIDAGEYVRQTDDGGYIITGYTESYSDARDVWLLKTDADGDSAWSKTFGGSLWDVGECVRQTADGGFIITGKTESFSSGMSDVWLIKTESDGDSSWSSVFGGDNTDKSYCVQEIVGDGYIIAGLTWSYGEGGSDAWVIRVSQSGELLWDLIWGGISNDDGGSIISTDDDGFAFVGMTESYGTGESDLCLVKLDVDPPAVEPFDPISSVSFTLHSAYPNPFNPTTVISFDLPVASQVKLDVYDVKGRHVGARLSRPYMTGSHQISFDGLGLASGIYIYRLQVSGSGATPTMGTGKMVLMK